MFLQVLKKPGAGPRNSAFALADKLRHAITQPILSRAAKPLFCLINMSFSIHEWPLSYVAQLGQRPPSSIDLIVVHCTELPDLDMAREYAERILYPSGTGNCGHYYIDRDGSLHRFVADDRIAHHITDLNDRSIGIELVNRGRWPNWHDSRQQHMDEAYPAAQIDSLLALIGKLRNTLPALQHIAGHQDLDTREIPASDNPRHKVRRKLDPGPMFPWPAVLDTCGLGRLKPRARHGPKLTTLTPISGGKNA